MKILTRDQPRRVAICTPCGDFVTADYAFCLAAMMQHTLSLQPPLLAQLSLHQMREPDLPEARNNLVHDAMTGAAQATHILWIDSDQRFPRDTLMRLLPTSLPIVGANIIQRHPPHQMSAARGGERLITTEDARGVEKVDRIGLGLTWVDVEVYRALEAPWYDFGRIDGQRVGEDYLWSRRALESGFTIHTDHDLSREVGHVGSFVFRPQHAQGATR